MALATINGQRKFFDTDKLVITPVSSGRWSVEYDRGTFMVVGGTKSGGARNEWFIHYPDFYGDEWLPCKSMVEALRLGVVY
jgi:hypothetical protein